MLTFTLFKYCVIIGFLLSLSTLSFNTLQILRVLKYTIFCINVNMLELFQIPVYPIFILSTRAGGLGLNL